MVSTAKAVTTDGKALYDIRYQKHQKDLNHTNFNLGNYKQAYDSEASATYQNHGSTVYAAAMEKTLKDVQKTNYQMGTDKHDWTTSSHVKAVALSKDARQAAIESKKMFTSVSWNNHHL